MDKQTTAAFILIGVILVIWLYFNAPEPQQNIPYTNDTTLADKPAPPPPPIEDAAKENAPSSRLENSSAPSLDADEQIITIENDLALIELTTKGARVRKYYLKEYETWYFDDLPDTATFYKKHVQLVNPSRGGDLNVVFVTKDGRRVNTDTLTFNSNGNNYHYFIEGDDSLELKFVHQFGDINSVSKNFKFYGNKYSSKIDIEMENMDSEISGYTYDLVWSEGINFVEENSVDEARYSKGIIFAGDQTNDIDPGSGEVETKDMNGLIDWVGVKNKYFAVILSPDNPSHDGGAYFEGRHILHPKYGEREYYTASLKIPFLNRNYQKDTFELYIGPIRYNVLDSYGRNYEQLYDFGSFMGLEIFRPISEYILLPLFKFLHLFIPNYGFVIIVFSIIIKFALYPLTKQSYKSMKKMQLLQPMIKDLKEKYKDEPQKVQKETMKLYSTYGVNPAGGCLPMLLQMPILVALWSMFNVAIELRHEPFMFWITNLSAPDIIYTLPFKLPIFGIDKISGLAPLLGISMFLQQKMTVKDPSQKAMVYMMPIVFTFMFMGFPSGLNLYYLMFNFFSVIQQQIINKSKTDGELVPVKNPKKKGGGFMARMMDAAEKQTQAQKKAAKKNKKF